MKGILGRVTNILFERRSRDRSAFDVSKYLGFLEKHYSRTPMPEEQSCDSYPWNLWERSIAECLRTSCGAGLSYVDPLEIPEIKRTMIFSGATPWEQRAKIEHVRAAFKGKLSAVENDILPNSIGRYRTRLSKSDVVESSVNNIHHLMHLAAYALHTKRMPWEAPKIVEFGGGYGNMARILKSLNRECTYIIIDLPSMLCIQHWFLTGALGAGVVSLEPDVIVEGKINLVTLGTFISQNLAPGDRMFLSTWALTEAPSRVQKLPVVANLISESAMLLLASACDENDQITGDLQVDVCSSRVKFLPNNHRYFLK